MPEKYKNKYRIKSARLPNWNYGNIGMYFITICTENRVHYFGEIRNGKMYLNEIGDIVTTEWLKTFEMRPDMNLQMGEYIIMPNHFHAIIIIGDNEYNVMTNTPRRDAIHYVSTTNTPKNKFGPQSKKLASIVRGFKIGVTKNARLINSDFGWQSRFHDHIIRNDKSFQNISNYIINNPKNWNEDKFFKKY